MSAPALARVARPSLNPRHILPAPPVLIERLSKLLKLQPMDRLALDYERLRDLENARMTDPGVAIAYDARLTMASAAFRSVPSVGIVQRTLIDAMEAGWEPPSRDKIDVLDFGCGTASGSWGVHAVLPHLSLEATLIDPSLPMIKTANHLCEEVFPTNWARNLVHLTRGLKTRKGAARFDVVIASFALSELPSDDARSLAAATLWDTVAVGGLLLVIEGRGPYGARIVRRAREEIIAGSVKHDLLTGSGAPGEAKVLAPCGHNKPCPLRGAKVENSSKAVNVKPYCFFQQHTDRLFAPGGRDSVGSRHVASFSYVAITKTPPVVLADLPVEELSQEPQSRVLRPPDKRKGHVYLELCTEGAVQRKIVVRRQRLLFKHARKGYWGMSWPPPAESDLSSLEDDEEEEKYEDEDFDLEEEDGDEDKDKDETAGEGHVTSEQSRSSAEKNRGKY